MTRTSLRAPVMRLLLDTGVSLLLLLCLAYWWLGNLTHEVLGTALAIVLVRHLVNNLHWWSTLRRGRYDLRRRLSVALTVTLAAAMLVVIVTGYAISRSLLGFLSLPGSFALAEIHMFAAHWVMVLAGLHIGLNWQRVMMLLRTLTRGGLEHRAWRWGLTAVAIVLAVQGLRSATVMDVWTRLRLEYSLVMWDFNAAAAQFFGHWLAIVALCAVAMHAIMRLLPRAAR